MSVVFPGEADAPVYLDIQLRTEHERGQREAAGQGGCQFGFIRRKIRPGGTPGARGRLLGGDQHVRAVVLDGLKGADGPSELDTFLCVFGRHLGARARTARCLGGAEGSHQLVRQAAGVAEHAFGGNANIVTSDRTNPPAWIDILEGQGGEPLLISLDQHDVITCNADR